MKTASPFKFLDPYLKKDKGIFFGREREVQLLYDCVNKNRIVLVYGQSGTGKTSIIQCGLGNLFESSDWLPFYIKRGEDLNKALLSELAKNTEAVAPEEVQLLQHKMFHEKERKFAAGNNSNSAHEIIYAEPEANIERLSDDDKTHIATVLCQVQQITELYLRPVYLIFDQFEELLILGSKQEKHLFIETLKQLSSSKAVVGSHIIIVMREEYFAWLDLFEKELPEITDRRMRVEAMRTGEIKEVILRSLEAFNITLSDPEKNIPQILTALSKRGEIALPYLQVYLDQLWRIDYDRTYPRGYAGEQPAQLTFTTEEINEFGEIDDVMLRFLTERRTFIQGDMKLKYPELADDFINRVLDQFVNDQGTKRPIFYFVENNYYSFNSLAPRILRESPKELVKDVLDTLDDNQLLRNTGTAFELSHDILAKFIDQQRDSKQRRLNNIRVMLKIYKKQEETIPYDLIKSWEKDLPEIELKEEEKALVDRSRKEGFEKESQAYFKDALQKEIARRKLRRTILLLILCLSFIGLLGYLLAKILRDSNSNYAVELVYKTDRISNKQDALWLAKYAYDFKKYDSTKMKIIEEKIMEIAHQPEFVSALTKFPPVILKSSSRLLNGLEVDISADGLFICIKNDSKESPANSWEIYNTKTGEILGKYDSLAYAYFLNESDTLLLAANRVKDKKYPSFITLFDCNAGKAFDSINLDVPSSKGDFLFDLNFMNSNTFTDWDSYKIRYTSAGDLVIPYQHLQDQKVGPPVASNKLKIVSPDRKIVASSQSDFSVSSSRTYDKIMYAYSSAGNLSFEIFTSSRKKYVPFSNAVFSDFTEDGKIVYGRNSILEVCDDNGGVIQRMTLPIASNYAYVNKKTDRAVVRLIDGSMGVVDFIKQKYRAIAGSLVSADFISGMIICRSIQGEDHASAKDFLTVFNMEGETVRKIEPAYGIESIRYNRPARSTLLLSKAIPGVNLQILYLLDDTLGIKASFTLTPNDSYGFSKDGKSIFYVRDNQLAVFDNKPLMNVADFKSVNGWLEKEKLRLGKKGYGLFSDSLKTKYDSEFPSKRYFPF
ncbi:MAG: ATPase [Ferruginibacter sp.]|nr:ATPase [Ferruginibacter sp.]